jgi:hypothetical protein
MFWAALHGLRTCKVDCRYPLVAAVSSAQALVDLMLVAHACLVGALLLLCQLPLVVSHRIHGNLGRSNLQLKSVLVCSVNQ